MEAKNGVVSTTDFETSTVGSRNKTFKLHNSMDDTIDSDSEHGNTQNDNAITQPTFTMTTANNNMASFNVDVGAVVAGGSGLKDNVIQNEQLYVKSRIDGTISMAVLGGLLFIACVATIDSHLENNDPSEITEAVLFTFCILESSKHLTR